VTFFDGLLSKYLTVANSRPTMVDERLLKGIEGSGPSEQAQDVMDIWKKYAVGGGLTSEWLSELILVRNVMDIIEASKLQENPISNKSSPTKRLAAQPFQSTVEHTLRTWMAENSSCHAKEKIVLSCLCAIKGLHFKSQAKAVVEEYLTACGRIINASFTPNKQQQVSGVNALW
jgi:hypothetical protein